MSLAATVGGHPHMNKTSYAIACGIVVASCGTGSIQPAPSRDISKFSYARIHCSPDNESHFEIATIQMAKVDAAAPALPFHAKGSQASRLAFASFDAGWGSEDLKARTFHAAPNAQYVVYLEGEMSITTSDGETRRFKPGDVVRVDDTAPCKGHISVVGDRPSYTMVVR